MKKLSLFILLLALDQIVKYFALKNLLPAAGGFFTSVCNPYISWGIPVSDLTFWASWIVATALLIYLLVRYNENIWPVAVLAGSASNIADRLVRGCVVDYVRLPVLDFPIFNLADVYITVGIIFFIFIFLRGKESIENLKS